MITVSDATKLFKPEWVTEVHYSGTWYQVKKGTMQEISFGSGLDTMHLVRYTDPFDDSDVIIMDMVKGWKFELPEPINVDTQLKLELEGD